MSQLEAKRDESNAASLAHLRRRALIPALLAQSLFRLPVGERLRAGAVCKEWYRAVQHPSPWRDGGWWCTRLAGQPGSMPLPAWLRAQLCAVRCSLNWLLSSGPLGCLRSFAQLRHLELLRWSGDATTSADELRQALAPLPLQSLLLPHGDDGSPPLSPTLVAALTQPSAQGESPLLVTWASSLTHLKCEVTVAGSSALLRTLSSCTWPLLQRLTVRVSYCGADVSTVSQQLRQWLSPPSVPMLSALKYRVVCESEVEDCRCAALDWPPLAGLRSLTELNVNWEREHSCLDFLRRISADALPLLRRLTVSGWLTDLTAGDEQREAVELLQRMPLTALRLKYDSGLGSLVRHLPHLRLLRCDDPVEPNAVAAIAAAPALQKLAVPGSGFLTLAQCWWRRMGCPLLQTNGRVHEDAWQLHIDKQAPPLICELTVEGNGSLAAAAFPYLALLLHLRVLECRLLAADLSPLGLLPQLEVLRLQPAWPPQEGAVEAWSDAALFTLGRLPLTRLHSLRLYNKDERAMLCKFDDQWLFGDDPDHPWDGEDEEGDTQERAVVHRAVTLEGLRSLLQLPALTALDLPWIEDRVLDEFRQLVQQEGRAALWVERPVPLSRRSLLERHWLCDDEQLGADS